MQASRSRCVGARVVAILRCRAACRAGCGTVHLDSINHKRENSTLSVRRRRRPRSRPIELKRVSDAGAKQQVLSKCHSVLTGGNTRCPADRELADLGYAQGTRSIDVKVHDTLKRLCATRSKTQGPTSEVARLEIAVYKLCISRSYNSNANAKEYSSTSHYFPQNGLTPFRCISMLYQCL